MAFVYWVVRVPLGMLAFVYWVVRVPLGMFEFKFIRNINALTILI